MRLCDLDPRWLTKDGRRVGFIFLSPTRKNGPVHWRQTCFFEKTPFREQRALVWAEMADQADEDREFGNWQPCKQDFAWKLHGEPNFETLTVTPSLDGSAGGLWHGFITNGQIVGGI
jgi:hypothetical protein